MCELLAVRSDEPFALAEAWPLAEGLERYGLAGYAWGVAWVRPDGSLDAHRAATAFRDDAAREEVGRTETTAALIHLRRPSRFSWLGMADTQPFLEGAGRFAFAHNGELVDFRRFRDAHRAAGRIHGRADSEVGMRWLEDAWGERSADDLLAALHQAMGGSANLAVLEPGGRATLHAGNTENPVFGFRLGGFRGRCRDGAAGGDDRRDRLLRGRGAAPAAGAGATGRDRRRRDAGRGRGGYPGVNPKARRKRVASPRGRRRSSSQPRPQSIQVAVRR